ncbi:MAG: response regulator [Desulfotignum sp.]
MVVEKDERLLHLTVNALTYCVNRRVKGFADSTKAWQHFKEGGTADIILSCVDAFDVNGFHLMTRARQHNPKLVFIAMSGVKDHEQKAREQGADGFLGKPFEIHDLFDIVQRYVVEGPGKKIVPIDV